MMKVLVAGANGQIGKQLTFLLHEHDAYSVKAMVRREEQAAYYREAGIECVIANLEGSVKELAEAARDCQAVVFTAGSGGATGYDKTLLIDLDGAVKMVEAAEEAKVPRFVMVSAIGAHHRESWNGDIKPYYAAKHYADRMLRHSSLSYTIIRPGGLLNEPGTGRITAAENIKGGSIPREDVAKTILLALDEEHTFRRSFDLISGETPISEALSSL